MYYRSIKIIVLVLIMILCIWGLACLSGCAPTDAAGNPMHYSSGNSGYSYKIYMNGEVVRQGSAVSIGGDGYCVIDDLFDGKIYTGWNNVVITEN